MLNPDQKRYIVSHLGFRHWPRSRIYAQYRLRPVFQAADTLVRDYADRLRAWLHVSMDWMRDELRRSAAGVWTVVGSEQVGEDIRRLEALISATTVKNDDRYDHA